MRVPSAVAVARKNQADAWIQKPKEYSIYPNHTHAMLKDSTRSCNYNLKSWVGSAKTEPNTQVEEQFQVNMQFISESFGGTGVGHHGMVC